VTFVTLAGQHKCITMFRLLFVDEWFLDSEPKETGRAFCALRHEDDVRWEHYHIKRLYKMMIMNKVFPSLEPHQFHNWKLIFSSTKASEPKRLITLKTVKWGNWNHNHHVLVEYQSQRKFQEQVFITLTNTKWSMSQYASRSNILPEQSSLWFSTTRVLFTVQVGSITTLEGIFRTIYADSTTLIWYVKSIVGSTSHRQGTVCGRRFIREYSFSESFCFGWGTITAKIYEPGFYNTHQQ